jgi:hypothetical protein
MADKRLEGSLRACWGRFQVLALLLGVQTAHAGILQIHNGYFWDPGTSEYFIPRGMAYQTWNPPVGASQSFPQLDYDLVEFKKMYANSVRAEFVWNVVENPQGVFDWSKPDHLVAEAEELGLRLFVLIGYQYAPDWFPNDWKATNDGGSNSVVLAYENPYARQAYSNYIAHVTSRYKNSPAIAAWILGNEYAYFDLWDPSRRFLGYDPYSTASFCAFLANHYTNNIAAANSNWGTSYPSFDAVRMPRAYPANRMQPLYYDLRQWRKKSIGDYVALAARTAKLSDPNHLRTYSMVGGLFGEADIFYTCEDARTIVKSCADVGAPLDFWSINNYAIATIDTELRSVDYGISKHRAASGLPVLITETGHTSTETEYADASGRQAAALPSEVWASLMSGSIGVHIFTWNERDLFSGNNFPREKGFGIVTQTREPKVPAYQNVANTFRVMEQIHLERLLGDSVSPAPDVQFFWPQASDMGWCRANHENYRLWSTLKRLGYELRLLQDEEFDSGAWAAAPALVLSRCLWMEPRHLDTIANQVVQAGIHVHANADLPGQFDPYDQANSKWAQQMSSLFGLNVAGARASWDAGATSDDQLLHPQPLNLTGVAALGPLTTQYSDGLGTWKIWQGLSNDSGISVVTDTGLDGTSSPVPALQTKDLGRAKTAINTFAIGDIAEVTNTSPPHTWDLRYDWLRAIYRDHFGLTPRSDLNGPGASYIYQNYRVCSNGSVLIGLLNAQTNSASITLTATNLLGGHSVEDLTSGGVLATNSSGILNVTVPGDEYVLLYAYTSDGRVDQSLVNPNANKLWIEMAPMVVWPNGSNWELTVGFDSRDADLDLVASFERVLSPNNKTYAQCSPVQVLGRNTASVSLLMPEPDLNDLNYISTPEGGEYVFHAWLQKEGVRVSETFLPVRLVWGVRPVSLPPVVVVGSTYQVPVEWQELPSYLPIEGQSLLDRAALWEPWKASQQYYKIVLELRSAGQVVASQEFLTDSGTGQHTFSITVPPKASGPFTWTAYLEPMPLASHDMVDSFEDRDAGADVDFFLPWKAYMYAEQTNVQFFAGGVDNTNEASDGVQSVFLVVTNPPNPGSYSGFGLSFAYPEGWSLPHSIQAMSNYVFACDFREHLSLPCVLELQIQDVRGGQIHFTKTYTPDLISQWDTIRASLDQFVIPPQVGFFDSTKVSQLVINVQMLQTSAMYQSWIDNVRFQGPETADPTISPHDFWDSFEDRAGGDDPSLVAPWSSYVYAQHNNAVWLAQGINSDGADGGHAAFVVVTNPPNPGAFSGFGLSYVFSNSWALPSLPLTWTNYSLSFDFKEGGLHRCVLELQLKSSPTNYIHFTKTYKPGSNGWDSIHPTLDQFTQPADVGLFDPRNVQAITLNISMLDKGSLYLGLFDNIYFHGPDKPAAGGQIYASYTSANDSFRIQEIGMDSAGRVIVSWPGNAVLQAAPAVNGPWTNVVGAAHPYVVTPSSQRLFYRLHH